MFQGRPILIVEDDAIIALGLTDVIESHEGTVVGPVSTVRDALRILDDHEVEAAILDVRLTDGEITPVALRLVDAGIPLVFHTGTGGPEALAQSHPQLLVIMKPAPMEAVVRQLRIAIGGRSG